jgi:hypothetical protein
LYPHLNEHVTHSQEIKSKKTCFGWLDVRFSGIAARL